MPLASVLSTSLPLIPLSRRMPSTRRLCMTLLRNLSRTSLSCPTYTSLALLGSQNPFFDGRTAAEIFWVQVCRTRRSPKKLRNDLYNQLAFNFLAVLSSTSGTKRTLPIALSATRENL